MNKVKSMFVDVIAFVIMWMRRNLPQVFSRLYSKRLNVETLDNTLVIVPHPDDDTFGCGMLIKSLCDTKKRVDVIILSKGEAVLPEKVIGRKELTDARRELAIAANKNLGLDVEHLHILDFPDNHFEDATELSKQKLCNLLDSLKPSHVFIPNPWEGLKDHVVASDVLTKMLKNYNVKVYYYCVWMYYYISIPMIFKLDFRRSFYLRGDWIAKCKSIDIYMGALTADGRKISGNLPELFLVAVGDKRELYFEA